MSRFFYISLSLLLLVGMSACDSKGRSGNAMSNPVVAKKAAALLDAIKANNFQQAIKQYPDSFFTKQTPEGWTQKLKALLEDRGPMRSYELKQSQADTRFSGKFFILEYMAVHEGAKRVNHIITLLSPVEGGEIKIIGHKMTPWLDERFNERLDERKTPLPLKSN